MSVNTEEQIDDTFDEIYMWLDQISFSRPRKNISRDFSNGVFMAELLKEYYPRYVDLHNYYPGNSLARKIDNWRTLNRKVLSKINMKLNDKVITQLAIGQEKIIENILIKLRMKILNDCNNERKLLYSAYEDDDIASSRVESVLDLDVIQNKTVPKSAFLKLQREFDGKKNIIVMQNAKILHLESLIKLKDQRIADLSTQIVRLEHH
ncbi:hypothetical protein PV325_001576 [Microctonus aethiopoides]|uniref:Calponin-homology (CH) domain-containing protein n=1 Tax=Microctonus aethiopoides TaxID=144406 RepID=A0AA39FN76_9HYME|nr:hypothetical protein PV325_001576 [Microctonus aethiopoides]KAK0098466.1 hypothetical protein PV326_008064 [Microctonus aethiopoides]KAK0172739.1 hypothetical protein PV328_006019 [Microctonus aethiopoides]